MPEEVELVLSMNSITLIYDPFVPAKPVLTYPAEPVEQSLPTPAIAGVLPV